MGGINIFKFEKKQQITKSQTRILDFEMSESLDAHRAEIILELKRKLIIDKYQTFDFSKIKDIASVPANSFRYSINAPLASDNSSTVFNGALSIHGSNIITTPVVNPNTVSVVINSNQTSTNTSPIVKVIDEIDTPFKFWIFSRKTYNCSVFSIYYFCAPLRSNSTIKNYNCYNSPLMDEIDIAQLICERCGSSCLISQAEVVPRNWFTDTAYYTDNWMYISQAGECRAFAGKLASPLLLNSTDPNHSKYKDIYKGIASIMQAKFIKPTFNADGSEKTNYKSVAPFIYYQYNLPVKFYLYYNRNNTLGQSTKNDIFVMRSRYGDKGSHEIHYQFDPGNYWACYPAGDKKKFPMQFEAFPRYLLPYSRTTDVKAGQKFNFSSTTISAFSSLPLKTDLIEMCIKAKPHAPYFSDLECALSVEWTCGGKDLLSTTYCPFDWTLDKDTHNVTGYYSEDEVYQTLQWVGYVDDLGYISDEEFPDNSFKLCSIHLCYKNSEYPDLDSKQIYDDLILKLKAKNDIPSDAQSFYNEKWMKLCEKSQLLIATPSISNYLENRDSELASFHYLRVYAPQLTFISESKGTVPTNNAEGAIQSSPNLFAENEKIAIRIPENKIDPFTKMPLKRYVKVTRLSHETLSTLISKSISLEKITEIIPQNFSYPFSAIVGTKIDSRAFSQIPVRTFDCKLKKVLVPSNYYPNDASGQDLRYLNSGIGSVIYSGDWDGTFKLSWTNNPAWILMDLLINKRYGLGNYIESQQVDIWELYKIARWCDAVDENGIYKGLADSYGGVEPRHAFNAIIKDKFNVFDMLNQIASVFRGHVYYMNSLITFEDDRPKPPIGEFNNSDIKDGLFNYANHKKDDEYTAVDVLYIDEKDNFKPKIEFVEDPEGIRKRGILKKEINAFGVTSKSQARRLGLHFLYQTSKESLNVSFSTDLKALLYKPGDFITINDELINSRKNYGTIKDVIDIDSQKFSVVIDKILNDEIYDVGGICLHFPKIKPKYDDFLYKAESYPSSLIITNLKFLEIFFQKKHADLNSPYPGFVNGSLKQVNTLEPVINTDGTRNYMGNINGSYLVKDSSSNPRACYFDTEIVFNYIENCTMNGDVSEYGHWQITTGNDVENSYCILVDSLCDPLIKFELPHKKYFFEYLDTGMMVKYKYINEFELPEYDCITFSIENNCLINDNFSHKQFDVLNYSNCKIKFGDIVETDRPSIDFFHITGNYETGFVTSSQDTFVCFDYNNIKTSYSGHIFCRGVYKDTINSCDCYIPIDFGCFSNIYDGYVVPIAACKCTIETPIKSNSYMLVDITQTTGVAWEIKTRDMEYVTYSGISKTNLSKLVTRLKPVFDSNYYDRICTCGINAPRFLFDYAFTPNLDNFSNFKADRNRYFASCIQNDILYIKSNETCYRINSDNSRFFKDQNWNINSGSGNLLSNALLIDCRDYISAMLCCTGATDACYKKITCYLTNNTSTTGYYLLNSLSKFPSGLYKMYDAVGRRQTSCLFNCYSVTGINIVGSNEDSIFIQKTAVSGLETSKIEKIPNDINFKIKQWAFGNEMYVAIGDSGKLASSNNLSLFSNKNNVIRDSSFGLNNINCIIYGDGLFVIAGSSGKLAISSDGINWQQKDSTFENDSICTLHYSKYYKSENYTGKIYLAGGQKGKIAISKDAISWCGISFEDINFSREDFCNGDVTFIYTDEYLGSNFINITHTQPEYISREQNYEYTHPCNVPYTKLYLSKYGYQALEENRQLIPKQSIKDGLDKLVGTSYSIPFLNSNSKTFKIMSINEEYVNEYNIFATEYDENKFYKIENSANSLYSIGNTFNFLNAHETAQKISNGGTLKSPIIKEFFLSLDKKSLIVQWKGVVFADKYKLYLKTPSKQTSNFQAEVFSNDAVAYDKNYDLYSFKMEKVNEIGNFTITIEAASIRTEDTLIKFSPPTSRTISILEY